MKDKLPKLIAVVGPTASGKSGLAIELAKQYNGELVCADSRQLYKGMTIGTAKDPGEWKAVDGEMVYVLKDGVIEHLVDILEPNIPFSVSEYQALAFETIDGIIARGKLPILVGGTGLYIQAVIDHLQFPDVAPNKQIRAGLEKRSIPELIRMYESCDPMGAASIDEHNKRRLIRAVEVCMVTRKPYSELKKRGEQKYDVLQIGLDHFREALYQRINTRTLLMVKNGLVDEVEGLIENGVSPVSSAMTGIGYRQVVDYLQGDVDQEEMIDEIQKESRRLAKRQLTWFKRDVRIKWVKEDAEGVELAEEFLKE